MIARGRLRVAYTDGRAERETDAGQVSAGPKGLTWSLGPNSGPGVVRWDDITSWSTFELAEPRKLRSPRRWTQVTIAVAEDLTLTLLAEPEEAKSLTLAAKQTLKAGTVRAAAAV